ncbi:MAG: hypothetical protein LBB45_01050 [Methanobrevibacter sp.]|nr:hypothetical protein [Candidatus Methanovirga basalitermitum]
MYEKTKGFKVAELIDGDIPYIARVAVNNGVSKFANNTGNHYPKNTITVHHE